jgi:hypothetical protein
MKFFTKDDAIHFAEKQGKRKKKKKKNWFNKALTFPPVF